ncbi:MAG: hypothetical protein AAB874_02825, partial [Patescibacteria group bacterium]
RDYLRCTLARSDTDWISNQESCSCPYISNASGGSGINKCPTVASCPATQIGMRNPEIEAYAVTMAERVFATPAPGNYIYENFIKTVETFTSFAGPEGTNYFRLTNANDLSDKLITILETISTTTSTIKIRRVTP